MYEHLLARSPYAACVDGCERTPWHYSDGERIGMFKKCSFLVEKEEVGLISSDYYVVALISA